MDTSTFVSVVIPVYNGANYLGEAVESVFSQTYPNIEVILVDDGSKDNTWELIQSYGDRVRGVRKENGGVASALNAGIRGARGDCVAWLSHDDLFYPQKIERQVGFLLDHPEFGACYTDFEIIDAQHKRLTIYRAPWYPSAELPRRFLRDMHINGSTILFRKSCLEEAGWFNENLAHTQDMDMWLRFSERSPIGHLGEVLLKSRSHPGQGSLNFELQISEEKAYFQTMYQRLGPAGIFPGLE
jgi:glycosyltransferase involved in cell wall biosynthesis